MEQPIFRNSPAVSLEGTLRTLAGNKMMLRLLGAQFSDAELASVLTMMRAGKFEGELGDRLYDFLIDELVNECTVVWEGLIPGAEDDYPVCVYSYAGVFHVWALEYDRVGYFLSRDDAMDYVYMNWDEVRDK